MDDTSNDKQNLIAAPYLSARDMIVEVLSREFPLGGKQILLRLNRYHGKSVSYQAVHKLLQRMVSQGVLVKDDSRYKISLRYAEQMIYFLEQLKEGYKDWDTEIVKEAEQQIDFLLENPKKPLDELVAELVVDVKRHDFVLEDVRSLLHKFFDEKKQF